MYERAPHSARCHRHPDRQAHLKCPQCQRYCCVFCWHAQFDRCEACLQQAPATAVPPIPWEQPIGWPQRFGRTLLTALSPHLTAPAFARPELVAALRFALLTALPLALLAGIMPHTRTLLFSPGALSVLKDSQTQDIVLDVLRAMGVEAAVDLAHLAAVSAPYLSLLKSYGGPGTVPFGVRALLYRAWLLPAAELVKQALFFVLGGSPVVLLLPQILQVLFLLSLGFTARLACGLGAGWSIVIVLISSIVAAFADEALLAAVQHILPDLAAATAATLPQP